MVELIRAAQTSPFIAYTVGFSTIEILHKAGIIGKFTTNAIIVILGVEIAGEAANDLEGLANAIFGKSANPDHLAELGSQVTVNAPTQGNVNPIASGSTPTTSSTILGGILSKVPEVLA